MQKRILILMNTIDAGGAETFIMKVFRSINREKIVFDFLINKKGSNFYLDEIVMLGGRVYYGFSKSKNPIKSACFIYKVVKQGNYKVVFCISVHPIGFIDLLISKIAGARSLLIRSTNSQAGGITSNILACMSRPCVRYLANAMYAPSKEAGVWLFGYNAVRSGKVRIIKNGLDVSRFIFNRTLRNSVRETWDVPEDCLVIGHIGRFNIQKNHTRLLDVFKSVNSINSNSVLVLVGDGEFRKQIEEYANKIGIFSKTIFLGIRNDIPELLFAFDAMVFPSFYEGMPNTIIEAQAADLPCVISDSISRDVKLTSNIQFLPLYETDYVWATTTIASVKKMRIDNSTVIESKGYSINSTTNILAEQFEV